MSKLENINQLICPETVVIGIFKRIEPYLRDLETLVAFASTAYTACGSGTSLGHTIKAAIDTRMKKCNIVLSQLLLRIARSPYRSFPCTGHAYCVVHEWWTANELEEIRTIRLSVSEEVTAIGEWLRCLHSFWWASGQFILGASTFTMAGLRDFLESGPIAMLRQVAVEEVTFLEPLKGQRLSIPIQIVSTFEQVALFKTGNTS
ncbi:hypothetical protein BKA70DRAFT_460566 [Coprinopsis sp. MPI-PUGE-AT-0042]|nr:hypothetical protein BKA70DRAFT_460566 [Coprinopsis sp. MPI-PUGE-AT-0042]